MQPSTEFEKVRNSPAKRRGTSDQCSWAYHLLGRACLLLDQRAEAQRLPSVRSNWLLVSQGFAAHVNAFTGRYRIGLKSKWKSLAVQRLLGRMVTKE